MNSNQESMIPLRAEIDRLDDLIIELLAQRYAILQQVVKTKKANGIPFKVNARVDEVINRNVTHGLTKGLPAEYITKLYTVIIDAAHDFEGQYLGTDKEW